jgi:hypothetical protein
MEGLLFECGEAALKLRVAEPAAFAMNAKVQA